MIVISLDVYFINIGLYLGENIFKKAIGEKAREDEEKKKVEIPEVTPLEISVETCSNRPGESMEDVYLPIINDSRACCFL